MSYLLLGFGVLGFGVLSALTAWIEHRLAELDAEREEKRRKAVNEAAMPVPLSRKPPRIEPLPPVK